ncbi:2,5-dichloro-2,5-cyclohexadiene-1,4-diol dehydrogenase LinX-like [Oppia nitens]|uniref:2,5-dichloro-2,5-cyclohexadiene-1,4-diol dehydrogenase LinX-like n=1 Tax=Oppia nitens TaxID=1686743 RepID=UPI0023DBE02F|nr:2,5-dichloro-2,5-cyclohexadiene-1,4-diol dehydrogenase LinX-like [Oppia nitens]
MNSWDDIFNTDLRAMVNLIHESVPYLEKTNGTIISISSITGYVPTAPWLAYSTVKAAVNMLSRNLALELGPKGIRVNTINPGATDVERTTGQFPEMMKFAASKTPLKRNGEPLDVAKGVVFLASTDASYITAANLIIDGGVMYNWPAYMN